MCFITLQYCKLIHLQKLKNDNVFSCCHILNSWCYLVTTLGSFLWLLPDKCHRSFCQLKAFVIQQQIARGFILIRILSIITLSKNNHLIVILHKERKAVWCYSKKHEHTSTNLSLWFFYYGEGSLICPFASSTQFVFHLSVDQNLILIWASSSFKARHVVFVHLIELP